MHIAESPFAQRIGFLPTLIVSAHHEHRGLHTQLADAFEYVEALSPQNGIANARHHHVQQNQIEALSLKDAERVSHRTRGRDLICVFMPEGRHDVPHHVQHPWLVIDNEDTLRCLRVHLVPFGPHTWSGVTTLPFMTNLVGWVPTVTVV